MMNHFEGPIKRTTTTREMQEKESNLHKVVRPPHVVEGLYPKPSPPRPEGAFAIFRHPAE